MSLCTKGDRLAISLLFNILIIIILQDMADDYEMEDWGSDDNQMGNGDEGSDGEIEI